MKQFSRIDMGEFEGVKFQDAQDTWGEWASDVVPGLTFYAVSIYSTSTGASRSVGRSAPARKNLSGAPCINGWCGTTDNVDVTAEGHWRVVQARRLNGIGNGSVFSIEAVEAD